MGEWISRASDIPVLGHLLYRLNVSPPVIRMMARGHVYANLTGSQGERLAQKMDVVSAPGARHTSIRFVTGMLDLMVSRTSFVDTARGIKELILVVYGAATPTRSKAEMLALVDLPNVRSVELPFGKLAVHEEFPDTIAEAVRSFLAAWEQVTLQRRGLGKGSTIQTPAPPVNRPPPELSQGHVASLRFGRAAP